MPLYVYRCPHNHDEELAHGFNQNPLVLCALDAEVMNRVPQPLLSFYRNANDTLYDWCEVNLHRWKKRIPRFSPYHVNNPDGIPQVAYNTRKRVKPNVKQSTATH